MGDELVKPGWGRSRIRTRLEAEPVLSGRDSQGRAHSSARPVRLQDQNGSCTTNNRPEILKEPGGMNFY